MFVIIIYYYIIEYDIPYTILYVEYDVSYTILYTYREREYYIEYDMSYTILYIEYYIPYMLEYIIVQYMLHHVLYHMSLHVRVASHFLSTAVRRCIMLRTFVSTLKCQTADKTMEDKRARNILRMCIQTLK